MTLNRFRCLFCSNDLRTNLLESAYLLNIALYDDVRRGVVIGRHHLHLDLQTKGRVGYPLAELRELQGKQKN